MKNIIKNHCGAVSIWVELVICTSAIVPFSFSQYFTQNNLHLLTTISGENKKDNFSIVAGIGDVNGDGFDDMIVGAPGGNYAKLYFGSSPLDTLKYIKLVPDNGFTYGASVAGGGDLNGDDYADFIIGAPQSSVFEPDWYSNAGKVFVYLGGAQIDTIPYMVLKGQGWYYDFGRSVAFAGDVNNDGYDDIIIGAPNDDIDGHGRAYIYYGGAEMDSIADVFMEGEAGADAFGGSVSGAGDVNKDGFDDVLIGATQWGAVNPMGKAYLVYGGNEIGLENATLFIDSSAVYFGWQVSGLGDVNGDSYDDFGIIGLNYCDIISGKTLQSLINIFERPEWASFVSISAGGDCDKDGYDDILISTEKIDTLITGGVLIYLGRSELNPKPDYEFNGQLFPSSFGSSISNGGNIDSRGRATILIGDDQGDATLGPGRVYIFSYDLRDEVKHLNNQNLPTLFKLYQNYPNPFNSSTTISYNLSISSFINIDIYNYAGQAVKTLVSEIKGPGQYSVIWNGIDENNDSVSSGIYIIKMTAATFGEKPRKESHESKLLLIK